MNQLIRSILVLCLFAAIPAFACPPTEGDYTAKIVVDGTEVGTITNSVHFKEGSSVQLKLNSGITLGAGGAAAFLFNDETSVAVFRRSEGGFAIQGRYVEAGQKISFNLKSVAFDQVNIQFVNGRFGSRPRGPGCGGPLVPFTN